MALLPFHRKIARALHPLHCPHNLRQDNERDVQAWIDSEIAREKETQRQARLTAWRQRLRGSARKSWQWLGRGKKTPPLAYTYETMRATLSAEMISSTNWKTVAKHLSKRYASQLGRSRKHRQHPWPQQPTPDISPLASEETHAKARKLIGKAPGPDGWTAAEVAYAPDEALKIMSTMFNAIENGQAWPNVCQWKQLRVTKPGKPRPPDLCPWTHTVQNLVFYQGGPTG